MIEVKFTWRGVTWLVRMVGGAVKYKDAAHLGGPWSMVIDTLKNPSIDLSFRKALAGAERELLKLVEG